MSNTPNRSVPPNHWDLYVIVVGVVLGVLLGPAVLGRISPDTYRAWFVAPQMNVEDLQGMASQLDKLGGTGVTEVAVREKTESLQRELNAKHVAFQEQAHSRPLGLILAVLLLMVVESLLDSGSPLRGRLVMARYGLVALWLALLLAQPGQLRSVPVVFVGLLVVVAMVMAALPIGKRGS